jgi:hypothetical protein
MRLGLGFAFVAYAAKFRQLIVNLQPISEALFAVDGVVNTTLYVPQMFKTWKVPTGTSLGTWGFWTITSADGVFYAVVCAKNLELALVLGGNLLGCATIFLIAFLKRGVVRHQGG